MKLALGCWHRWYGHDWTHIDLYEGDNVDIVHSVDNLPMIKDDSCDLVYASHVLEYFDWQDAEKIVLPEWRRVLKKGGILRLAVPDFRQLAYLYSTGRIEIENCIGLLYGRMKLDYNAIYHKSCYDAPKLTGMLLNVGFESVRPWYWEEVEHGQIDDHSQCFMLPDRDKENGIRMSLNIEAIK